MYQTYVDNTFAIFKTESVSEVFYNILKYILVYFGMGILSAYNGNYCN